MPYFNIFQGLPRLQMSFSVSNQGWTAKGALSHTYTLISYSVHSYLVVHCKGLEGALHCSGKPAPNPTISFAWLLHPPPAYLCIFPWNSAAAFSEQSWGNESDNESLHLLLPLVTVLITFCTCSKLFQLISRTPAPERLLNVPGPHKKMVQDKNMGCTMLCQMPNALVLRHLLLRKPMTLV